MKKRIGHVAAIAALAGGLHGCGGARGALTFDGLRYPVSSSAFLYAADEREITDGQLQSVGVISTKVRLWSVFWSFIPITGTKDLSQPINDQIAQAGGEGATRVHVRVEGCGLNFVPFINWIPLYPGCTLVTVSGSVVKQLALPPVADPLPAAGASPSHRRNDYGSPLSARAYRANPSGMRGTRATAQRLD